MRTLSQCLLLTIGLLVVSGGAQAQYREFGRETLQQVRADLDRAERDVRYIPEEEFRRFRRVREELRDFQGRWERGRFDKDLLDDIIGNIQHIVDRGRLRDRDREFLQGDANRLREMRSRFDRWRDGRR